MGIRDNDLVFKGTGLVSTGSTTATYSDVLDLSAGLTQTGFFGSSEGDRAVGDPTYYLQFNFTGGSIIGGNVTLTLVSGATAAVAITAGATEVFEIGVFGTSTTVGTRVSRRFSPNELTLPFVAIRVERSAAITGNGVLEAAITWDNRDVEIYPLAYTQGRI